MLKLIQTERVLSNRWIFVAILIVILVIAFSALNHLEVGDYNLGEINDIKESDTVWVMACSAFITLIVIPGVSLFYSGYVDEKNQINSLAMIYSSFAITCIVWILWGYALAFGEDVGGVIGSGRRIFLQGMSPSSIHPLAPSIPEYVYLIYQMTFAAVACALLCGGAIDRIRFRSWIVLIILWTTFVYVPITHWIWGQGFLEKWGMLDFAGGMVVHVNSGIGAFVISLILGPPVESQSKPKSMTFIVIGTSLMWFGWFGFNGGSTLKVNCITGVAFINTGFTAAVSSLSWVLIQTYHTGKPTLGGLCDGTIAGLVAITPAAGYVNIMGAFTIGLLSMGCYWITALKDKYEIFYDPGNAYSIHFVGGLIGTLAAGIYADPSVNTKSGILFGNFQQILWQFAGMGVVVLYAGVVTALLMYLLKYTIGICASEVEQKEGLNKTQHGEYSFADIDLEIPASKPLSSRRIKSSTFVQRYQDKI